MASVKLVSSLRSGLPIGEEGLVLGCWEFLRAMFGSMGSVSNSDSSTSCFLPHNYKGAASTNVSIHYCALLDVKILVRK